MGADGLKLVYVGIDEAGYGPLLGPLCVGCAAFEVDAWEPGAKAPDLWKLMRGGVCRKGADAVKRGRIAIDDSKKLKLANDSEKRHPLFHLERGVLSMLWAQREEGNADDGDGSGGRCADDAALFERMGVGSLEEKWYASEPSALPLGCTADELSVMASLLSGVMERAGVEPRGVCARAVSETAFNDGFDRMGTKAAVSFERVAEFLRGAWDEHAAREDLDEHGPRVVVDRQGGRTSYAGVLGKVFPEAEVRVVEECEARSRYEIVEPAGSNSGARPRRMSVMFTIEAEGRHLPVALASMAAKLVRELFMARFNRYWCGRVTELKPTAGYNTDARRWLRDAREWITEDERRTLVRRA